MISNLPMQAQLINEASNDLESLITGLWEDVFGFSPIGLQDDFFQLGGNSLHAARLVAKIRALTGRDLPLESFLYAPTIERLALLMRADDTVSSSTLVTLREGTRERPLFIAHSMSGTLLELWALARELNCQCAVYGIQGRGLREGEVPSSRVEDMAADYIEQIRSVQPHGPYALAGFSMGGLIALEIAQQLLQCGETVERVALLDTQLDEQCLAFQDWLLHQRLPCRVRTSRAPRPFLATARRLHSCESRPFRRPASRGRGKSTKARQRRRARASRCAQSIAAPTEDHSGFAGRHGRISPEDVLWQSNLFSCSRPQSALAGSASGMEGRLP